MKYITAVLVFFLAVMLQLWFAPAGFRGDFVVATLIVFAFLFDAWALAGFSLAGAFLMDPELHPGVTLLMFVLVPFVIFFLRSRFPLNPLFGVPISIVLGIGVFYAVVAPVAAMHFLMSLLLDVVLCALFGEAVWYGMERQ